MDACSVCSIWCRTIDRLSMLLRLIDPFASYGIYDIEHAQFVGCRGLFEVSVDFLNEYRLGLQQESLVSIGQNSTVRRIPCSILPGRCSRRERLVWRYEIRRLRVASNSAWHSGQPLILLLPMTWCPSGYLLTTGDEKYTQLGKNSGIARFAEK